MLCYFAKREFEEENGFKTIFFLKSSFRAVAGSALCVFEGQILVRNQNLPLKLLWSSHID
ncbi:MAG: hypothetical protein ACJAYJ_000335 [Saprospiraceae bacterium]